MNKEVDSCTNIAFDMSRIVIGLFVLLSLFHPSLKAQVYPDQDRSQSIHTVLMHPVDRPRDIPVIGLNDPVPLDISFDDFTANYQDYYYAIELVGANWEPVAISPFDYTEGFSQNKITQFTASSLALQTYFHYQFRLPNENCRPTKAGNYILKVFKGGDPSQIVFTRRFYVADNLIGVYAAIQEPFEGSISKTHHKVQLSLDVKKVPYFQPDQIKVYVFQNHRYNEGKQVSEPSFIRANILEYNSERDLIFPAGKECRWLDIQSLRLRTDRIAGFENKDQLVQVLVKPDLPRSTTPYFSFNDLNGARIISNTESIEPSFQNDYAQVHFTYIPKEGIPYIGENLYLIGDLTNNKVDKEAEMNFNAEKGWYEKTLLLKQGYYSYQYILRDMKEPNMQMDFSVTEGDHWETENNYTILVYYTAPGARFPSLAGFSTINSKQNW